MKYTTKTEYGLLCMIHLTKNPKASRVSIKEMGIQENFPKAYIEKILQSLRQANLVVSRAGSRGGYALALPATEITLRQIIEAVEGSTFDIFCSPKKREHIVCTHYCLCGVKPIWRKTKKLLDQFYDTITLDMLTKNELEVQPLIDAKK